MCIALGQPSVCVRTLSTIVAATTPSVAHLRQIGSVNGLDAIGVARAEVFESTLRDLERRKADGLAADMQFTYRNPGRSTDPTRALPDARSLVVAARSYLRSEEASDDDVGASADEPSGRVARYVWEDH